MLDFILRKTTESWFCDYCSHNYWYDVKFSDNNLLNVLKEILCHTSMGSIKLEIEGWQIPLTFRFKHTFLIDANDDLFYFITRKYQVDKIKASCNEFNTDNMNYIIYISSENNPFTKNNT